MNNKELETLKYYEKQINNFKLIINFNKSLRLIGLGSLEIAKMEKQLKEVESQLNDLKTIPMKFNSYFSNRGWISYDSINIDFMKNTIQIFEDKGIDEAEKHLYDYYKPDKLKFELIRLRGAPQIFKRNKLIEYAFEDYKCERYYSVVPILLMVIDGAVNEVLGKGFHAESADLNVWDSITNLDGGINKIKDIFRTGRNKTRDEIIDMPYRNGIMHGNELGYDNYKVAAKSWHFLFVIRDWIISKRTEPNRLEKYLKGISPPSIIESLNSIAKIEKEKDEIRKWEPRIIANEYLNEISTNNIKDESLPEITLIKFIELWKNKNYGYMANKYWSMFFSNGKPNISDVRNMFKNDNIINYKITNITDEAPAISNIEFKAEINDEIKNYNARLIFEGEDNQPHSRNSVKGQWKIVFIQLKEL